MTRAALKPRRWTGLAALLALLALAVNGLSPPGFMLTPGRDGPAVVICTGHGPATAPIPADHGHDRSGKGDHACAFAGHGVASTPPHAAGIVTLRFAAPPIDAVRLTDLTPGRGLAAPPPPSQAPPRLS